MTRTHLLRLYATVGALALGASGCSSDAGTGPPITGPVTVSLATPNSDDGALLISVLGPELSAVQPASTGYQVYWRPVSENETRIVVVGDIVAGPIISATASSGAASVFTASVSEVASRANVLRTSTDGYALRVIR